MSPLYLLDTNIISDAARDPRGRLALRMTYTGLSRLFTSVVVVGEIEYGLRRNPGLRVRRQLEWLLDSLEIRELPVAAAAHYAQTRAMLMTVGQPIGENDFWIAAHAMAEDAVLVTNNVQEFNRIPGLLVENWIESVG